MTAALGHYADRGVFRGFRATQEARGRVGYDFFWLTRRPMRAVFDGRGVLTFPALLPKPAAAIVSEIRSMVAERSTRAVPDHKRIDARRATLTAKVRSGDVSLAVDIRGANHQYAVSKTLNLVNEMFVALHERHPDYLVEHFGISQE
ncbi:MAG TPA: hypothetical protein VFZ31_00510 [Vicinamibacterales bacterium]